MDERNQERDDGPARPVGPDSSSTGPGTGQTRRRALPGDAGQTGPAGGIPAGPAGLLPPEVERWRPQLPGDRLLLPESWLATLWAAGEGTEAGGMAGGPPARACIAYTGDKSAAAPAGGPGTRPGPAPETTPWPRVLLATAGGDEAAALLAGEGAPGATASRYDGVVLADPADLERLLARRPDLARPRGGRPCWALLLFREDDAPGPWARDWARVVAWSPAALPPVVVPEDLLTGREPVAPARLWRARQALLRALEEPVPAAVACRWPSAGEPVHLAGSREEGTPLWWLVS